MMNDLKFRCIEKPDDAVRIEDFEHGKLYIGVESIGPLAEIILSRQDSEALRDWLIEYLRIWQVKE